MSAMETWTLRRQGSMLSRIELLGADDAVLARLRPIDATRTDVRVADGADLRIDQSIEAVQIGDGRTTLARASDGVLTVGLRRLDWQTRDGQPSAVVVRSPTDPTALLHAHPGPDGPSRWATLEVHDDLPEPLAVALLASAALLRREISSDRTGSPGWSSAGPASIG